MTGRNCGNQTFYRRTEVDGKEVYEWMRMRCKSWSCDACGPLRAWRLRKAIEGKSRELELTRFLTLTVDPKKIPDGVDSVKYLRGQVWAKFRTYLKRQYGTVLRYISILEFTEAGRPHLHVLIDRYVPQEWISKSWEALGGGKVVFVERVRNLERTARYLAKYLTKKGIMSCPHGVRRWTASRGIKLIPKREGTGWQFADRSFDLLYSVGLNAVLAEERDGDGSVRSFMTEVDLRGPVVKAREAWEDWVV